MIDYLNDDQLEDAVQRASFCPSNCAASYLVVSLATEVRQLRYEYLGVGQIDDLSDIYDLKQPLPRVG